MALCVAVVGISYAGNSEFETLPFAREDALKILDALKAHPTAAIRTFVAVESEATSAESLRDQLKRFFREAALGDDIVFVFEGHGLLLENASCFAASDASENGRNTFSLTDLLAWMNQRSPRNCILFLDACHSGQNPNRGIEKTEHLLSSGVSILSACDLHECAIDCDEIGGGLFSFIVMQALRGMAGSTRNSQRVVTVSDVFRFVAWALPAWINAHRNVLGIPGHRTMTPRWVADFRYDPILAAIPLAPASLGRRRSWADSLYRSETGPRRDALCRLGDVAKTIARRCAEQRGPHFLRLDAANHLEGLRSLLGQCLDDIGGGMDANELLVLELAVLTHDLGLLIDDDAERFFVNSAAFVRQGEAGGLPLRLPEPSLTEPVAQVIEAMAFPGPVSQQPAHFENGLIRMEMLGLMLRLAHRLEVFGHRMSGSAGGDEAGRRWLRRRLLTGLTDWAETGAATAYVLSGIDPVERAAVEGWHAQVASILTRDRLCDRFGFGPLWIDLRDES